MHGHGARSRSQRGPSAPGEAPRDGTVGVRRYRCKQCGQTVTVAPRGVLRRRLYAATALGLALALFGLEKHSACAVRDAIAPAVSFREAAEGASWSTLRRWSHEAKAGTLLDAGRTCPESFTLRQAAERLAVTLEAQGPRGSERVGRVWQGALEARWRGAS